jgi:hypothetical protein
MKKLLLSSILTLIFATLGYGQYPYVSIHDIQFVSQQDLTNCTDLSQYEGDTVRTVGIAIHDGRLTELASGSVSVGYRPGIHLIDTANGGVMGDFNGIQIHGVINNQGITALDGIPAGSIVEVTGIIQDFNGETQMYPLSNSDVRVLGFASVPQAQEVNVSELQTTSQTNVFETGEAWEGSFVEIKNVRVVGNTPFSNGTRVTLDVIDEDGHIINIGDRYIAGKLRTHNAVNNENLGANGTLDIPPIGTFFESIKGIVTHSSNGCTGRTGGGAVGYLINPFDSTHYVKGATPPTISNVTRTPLVPTSDDDVTVSAEIEDTDGTITEATLFYSMDMNQTADQFTSVNLTLVGGSATEYEGTMPSAADGQVVRYFIKAVDNDSNESYSPFNANATNPNFHFYTVRNDGLTIEDVQRVLDVTQDASPYVGEIITVKGYVTASARDYDLGSIYIQELDKTEWAGINLVNNSALLDVYRNEEIEVTGLVQESFGFTQISVTSLTKTGNKAEITPIEVPVTDSALRASREFEKYEGMLVKMVDASGKVYIANPRLSNFGEYTIANDSNANFINSTRVQAGISNNNNQSSLWVSVVSDSSLIMNNGEMEVPFVKTEKGQSMDAMVGLVFFGFGQYTVKPRNNDDFINFSVELDSTNYDYGDEDEISVSQIVENPIKAYPNPVNDILNLTRANAKIANISIIGIDGKVWNTAKWNSTDLKMDVAHLPSGVFIVTYQDDAQQATAFRFIKL